MAFLARLEMKRTLFFLSLYCALTMSAHASSLFEFAGYVTGAIATAQFNESGPPKVETALIGEPFTASLLIQNGIGTAVINVNVPGAFYINPGFPDVSTQGPSGGTFIGPVNANFEGVGNSGSIAGLSISDVVPIRGSNLYSGTLTATFSVEGINIADDSGTLKLTLSAVPLPPALPMFAAALLVLGFFGFISQRKDRSTKAIATSY
jgi:hypothetical protein